MQAVPVEPSIAPGKEEPPAAETITEPAKLLRIASMVRELLEETRHADRGCSADRHRPDGIGHLRRGPALELDLVVGKTALVEDDHPVVLETQDLLGF